MRFFIILIFICSSWSGESNTESELIKLSSGFDVSIIPKDLAEFHDINIIPDEFRGAYFRTRIAENGTTQANIKASFSLNQSTVELFDQDKDINGVFSISKIMLFNQKGMTGVCLFGIPNKVKPESPLILFNGGKIFVSPYRAWNRDDKWVIEPTFYRIFTLNKLP